MTGTTNSTEKDLNKNRAVIPVVTYSNWTNAHVIVNAGNMKESDGKLVNGKFVSGKVNNNTYTLALDKENNIFEETGEIVNWSDFLTSDGTDRVYGHPDKFVYDYNQQYQNCGIESVLNLLSMAGKKDIVEPTEEQIEKLKQPYTVKVRTKYRDWVEQTIYPTVTSATSTEDAFLLEALNKDYVLKADRETGLPVSETGKKYKYSDLNPWDGGTYFGGIVSEQNQYKYSLYSLAKLLNENLGGKTNEDGKFDKANLYSFKSDVLTQSDAGRKLTSYEETEEETESSSSSSSGSSSSGSSSEAEEIIDFPSYEITYREGSGDRGDVSISSKRGDDILIFSDVTIDEILKSNEIESYDKNLGMSSPSYSLAREGRDLYILYSPTSYVKITNYYYELDDKGNPVTDENGKIVEDRTHIRTVKCSVKDENGNIAYYSIPNDSIIDDNPNHFTDADDNNDYIVLAQKYVKPSEGTGDSERTYKKYVRTNDNKLYYYAIDSAKTDELGNTYYRRYKDGVALDEDTDIIIGKVGDDYYKKELQYLYETDPFTNTFILGTNLPPMIDETTKAEYKTYMQYNYSTGENYTYYRLGDSETKDMAGNTQYSIYVNGEKQNGNKYLTKETVNGETYYKVKALDTENRTSENSILLDSGKQFDGKEYYYKYNWTGSSLTFYVKETVDDKEVISKYVNGERQSDSHSEFITKETSQNSGKYTLKVITKEDAESATGKYFILKGTGSDDKGDQYIKYSYADNGNITYYKVNSTQQGKTEGNKTYTETVFSQWTNTTKDDVDNKVWCIEYENPKNYNGLLLYEAKVAINSEDTGYNQHVCYLVNLGTDAEGNKIFAQVTEESLDLINSSKEDILAKTDMYNKACKINDSLIYYYAAGTDENGKALYTTNLDGEPVEGTYSIESKDGKYGEIYMSAYESNKKNTSELYFLMEEDSEDRTKDLFASNLTPHDSDTDTDTYIQIGTDKDGKPIIAASGDKNKFASGEKCYYIKDSDGKTALYVYDIHGTKDENSLPLDVIGVDSRGREILAINGEYLATEGTYYLLGKQMSGNVPKIVDGKYVYEYTSSPTGGVTTYNGKITGGDYYVKYTDTTYAKMIKDAETNEYKIETTEDGKVKEYTTDNIDPQQIYEKYTLENFIGKLGRIYDSSVLSTNTHQYGTFVKELAELVREGKGVILSGNGASLASRQTGDYIPRNHAITLVGVAYSDEEIGSSVTGVGTYILSDIKGFYVVDTGGFLASTGSAQFVNCNQLYDFITCSNYNKNEVEQESDYINGDFIISTEFNIREWADKLNLVGNAYDNTLIGNNSNNVLKGGAGIDNLLGYDGNDTLYGGTGDDWLYGGAGDDVMRGEAGRNTYVFSIADGNGSLEQDKDGNYKKDEDGNYIVKQKQEDVIYPNGGKTVIRFRNLRITKNGTDAFGHAKYLIGNNSKWEIKGGSLLITYRYDNNSTYELSALDFEENGIDIKQVKNDDYYNSVKEDMFNAFTKAYTTIPDNECVNTIEIKNYEKYKNSIYLEGIDEIIKNYATGLDEYICLSKILDSTSIATVCDTNSTNKVTGSKYNDNITAGNKGDVISAGAGNDTVTTGLGNDTVKLGSGNNTMNVTYGNNKIYSEKGVNTINFVNDSVTATGYNTIYTGSKEDTINLNSVKLADLKFARSGNNLVVYYDENASSITVTNYFAKKGNTSVKVIELADGVKFDLTDAYYNGDYTSYDNKTIPALINTPKITAVAAQNSNAIEGTIANETIKGTKESNEIITGGKGSDKLYSNGGSDTFKFNTLYDGNDIIYAQGSKNTITIDMKDVITDENTLSYLKLDGISGFDNGFSERHLNDEGKNHAYSKVGNDLIINYGQTKDQEAMSSIRISNFFKYNNDFILKTNEDDEGFNLKEAEIFFEGQYNKANKITGSNQNDIIWGGNLNDTLNGAKGDDTLIGGLGNDTVTGGTGNNIVKYAKGDGVDTIKLTKYENLKIELKEGDFNASNLTYAIEKGNLLIKNYDENILILKNFGKSDVTTALGSVKLYIGDELVKDLRKDFYLDTIDNFSAKKKSYTGNWHAEIIDADESLVGVTVNGGAGDDIIIGSSWNDTLKGGNDNDILVGEEGKNTLDGGNGDDNYYMFGIINHSIDENGKVNVEFNQAIKNENTVIKDTGKKTDTDTAIMYASKDSLNISMNITNKTKAYTGAITFEDTEKNNKASITGVENIILQDGETKYRYNLDNLDNIVSDVVGWLNQKGYANVNAALKNLPDGQTELQNILASGWVQQ